jgi:hypothetical protein
MTQSGYQLTLKTARTGADSLRNDKIRASSAFFRSYSCVAASAVLAVGFRTFNAPGHIEKASPFSERLQRPGAFIVDWRHVVVVLPQNRPVFYYERFFAITAFGSA